MASSSALWVRGLARLTSSASSSWVKIGPWRKLKRWLARSKTDTPMMSAGSRSLVNCTRCQASPSTCASACARVVLPTPGHVLDQQVAARQQAGEAQADLRRLAEDDRLERGQRAREAAASAGAAPGVLMAPAARARARAAR